MTSNARRLQQAIRGVKTQVAATVDRRAADLSPQAQGLLFVGLNVTIYGTEPGRIYQRTQDLQRGAHATVKRVRRGIVEVNVWNTEPYALAVEFGVYGDHVPEPVAVERAGRPGAQPSPLVTGRSGANWTQPSLAHTRALLWPLYRLRLDVRAAVIRAWANAR